MQKLFLYGMLAGSLSQLAFGAIVSIDTSAVTPGAVTIATAPQSATVRWKDSDSRQWSAEFSLDSTKALITSVEVDGKKVIDRASPVYRASTGKRRGGWDAFFDFPPSAPEGTRSFLGEFHATGARAVSIGDRMEVSFSGMKMGIFEGSIRYVFYPGSRLIKQEAVLTTQEPDTAYFYDAGLRMTADPDRSVGGNMQSHISYFDASGQFQTITPPYGSEWHPVAVRYRAVDAQIGAGNIAVFPAPHQYFFARDYTTNMGYAWHSSWRGSVSLGIRQIPDDNSPYYPWMNAPPGTEQHMSMFLLVDDHDSRRALQDVLRYTHGDKFPQLAGYKTFAPHWHLAYTVQAMEHGNDWPPPFKSVLKRIGVDSAMIMEFHGDGHPADTTGIRLKELEALYAACRAQSDPAFLLIPAEEANVHLGGHWSIAFPKPVFWYMSRQASEAFSTSDPKYGTVYRTGSAEELWEMVKRENGYAYQTHPRTKGSTGYPDKIRETTYFRDPRYWGAGWKAMPSDLSSPRLGERAFKTLDDMNNWGLKKRTMGEVDVFQLDDRDELYAHMNVNYVKLPELPSFDNYGRLLDAVARGDYFISTGEIVLPSVGIHDDAGKIIVDANAQYTYPLEMAEVVWGDGSQTSRKLIPLTDTHEFGEKSFHLSIDAKDWKWARFAIWDVAGNGAFTNPVWR
jgi:hypothetical protein